MSRLTSLYAQIEMPKSKACCILFLTSLSLIPPGLILNICIALLGLLSIGPPMLLAVEGFSLDETLVPDITGDHHPLDRPCNHHPTYNITVP